jgi:hypothetical protein
MFGGLREETKEPVTSCDRLLVVQSTVYPLPVVPPCVGGPGGGRRGPGAFHATMSGKGVSMGDSPT